MFDIYLWMPRRNFSTCTDQNNYQSHTIIILYLKKTTSTTLILQCFFQQDPLIMVIYVQLSPHTFVGFICGIHCASERWISWNCSMARKGDNSFRVLKSWLCHLLILQPYKNPANLLNINFFICKNGHIIYLAWLSWKFLKVVHIKHVAQIPDHNICPLGESTSSVLAQR